MKDKTFAIFKVRFEITGLQTTYRPILASFHEIYYFGRVVSVHSLQAYYMTCLLVIWKSFFPP